MRLDKYIAHYTDTPRSLAKNAIKRGRVTINGTVVKDQGKKVSDDDEVTMDGFVVESFGEIYLMLNKPEGFVCSTDPDEIDSVLELIDAPFVSKLHVAGRLDKDTTGLVLLTTDTKWEHRVIAPKRGCKKVYRVHTADPIDPALVEKFSEGVLLKDDDRPTRPAELEIISECEAFLTLTEGRYHQVKRMFGAFGNKVVKLRREKVGEIVLPDDLELGECRFLTDDEIASI